MGSVLLGRCKIARHIGHCPTTHFPANKGLFPTRGDAYAPLRGRIVTRTSVRVQHIIRASLGLASLPFGLGIHFGSGLGRIVARSDQLDSVKASWHKSICKRLLQLAIGIGILPCHRCGYPIRDGLYLPETRAVSKVVRGIIWTRDIE